MRNAVDHGLETPEARQAAGKAPEGQLVFEAQMLDEELKIEIYDDGRGINWQHIADLAAKKGLPANNHSDLVQALFSDGLSTKTEVTEISGRGVGTAAVLEVIQKLNGRFSVKSKINAGTRFSFYIPKSVFDPKLRAANDDQALKNTQQENVAL